MVMQDDMITNSAFVQFQSKPMHFTVHIRNRTEMPSLNPGSYFLSNFWMLGLGLLSRWAHGCMYVYVCIIDMCEWVFFMDCQQPGYKQAFLLIRA